MGCLQYAVTLYFHSPFMVGSLLLGSPFQSYTPHVPSLIFLQNNCCWTRGYSYNTSLAAIPYLSGNNLNIRKSTALFILQSTPLMLE